MYIKMVPIPARSGTFSVRLPEPTPSSNNGWMVQGVIVKDGAPFLVITMQSNLPRESDRDFEFKVFESDQVFQGVEQVENFNGVLNWHSDYLGNFQANRLLYHVSGSRTSPVPPRGGKTT